MAKKNDKDKKGKQELWRQMKYPGQPKKFATAYELWLAACDYFKWTDENPLMKAEWKDGGEIELPVRRPYTLSALCLFIGVSESYLRKFKSEERIDKDEYLTVIEQIEKIVYHQKFEGAASGFFNANIISRDLGLADKREVDANVNLKDLDVTFE